MKSRTILGFGATERITYSMIGSMQTLGLCNSMRFTFLVVLSVKLSLLIIDQSTTEWYIGAVLLKDSHTDSENSSSSLECLHMLFLFG